MISVQSHAKQIKLLNDYIAALEKQISSSRKENQLLQTSTNNSGEQQKRIMEELNRLRSQNGQVKYQNYKQQEQLRRLTGLQQEYFGVRQQLDREVEWKNQLVQENQRLEDVLKKEQDQNKAMSEDWTKKKQVWEMEAAKNKLQIEELRKINMTKDKKYTELTLMLSQERKNTTTKLSLIQGQNTNMIASKNESISSLTKEMQDLRNSLSFSISEGEKDRNELTNRVGVLESQQNQSKQKIVKLEKEVKDMDFVIILRNNEINSLKNSLKTKTEEFDVLLKKSTAEKRTLLQAMDKQNEQKKRAQQKIKQLQLTINSNRNQISILRTNLKIKTDEFDVLVKKASEQKLNLLQTIDGVGDTNTKNEERIKQLDLTVNFMDTEINTLRNNLKVKTQECDNLFKKSNGQKRSLLQSMDRLGEEKKNMQEHIRNLQLLMNSKNKENNDLKNNIKVKYQEFNILVQQTSQEKRILQQNINRLTEEKKNLQILNNACKGNISENSKALTDTLKQKEEVSLKLSSTSSLLQKTEKELEIKLNQIFEMTSVIKERVRLIEELQRTAAQRDKIISSLSQKLKNTETARIRAVRDGEGLTLKLNELHKQNQVQKQEFVRLTKQSEFKILNLTNQLQSLQKSKNQQSKRLNKIISDLQFDRDSKNMDLSETGQRITEFNHRMSELHEEKNKVQQNLDAIIQEYVSYKKRKQSQTEELTIKLKQSEKKVQKSRIKMDELSREIQELQSHHENKAQNITLSQKQEMQRIEARMNKVIMEIKHQSEEQIKNKDEQIQKLQKQIRQLEDNKLKALKKKQEEFVVKQQKLQSKLKQLTLQNQSLQQQIKQGNQSVVFEKQSKSTKQFQFQSLKDKITLLQGKSQEQKKVIAGLNTSIADKHKEYEVLEQSNALLRKQVINVLTRQETCRKELLEIKSSVGSAYLSKSIANINQQDIENISIYRNAAQNRRRTHAPYSKRDQTQRVMSRKLQAPTNLASSMVKAVTTFNDHFENTM